MAQVTASQLENIKKLLEDEMRERVTDHLSLTLVTREITSSLKKLETKTSNEVKELFEIISGNATQIHDGFCKVEKNVEDQIFLVQCENVELDKRVEEERNDRITRSAHLERTMDRLLALHDRLTQLFSTHVEEEGAKSKENKKLEENFLSEIQSVRETLKTLIEENDKLKEKQTEMTNKLSDAEHLKEQVESFLLENSQLRELLEAEKNDRLTDNTRHENALKEMHLLQQLEEKSWDEMEEKFLSEIQRVRATLNTLVEENAILKEKQTEMTNKLSNAENLKEQVNSFQLENAQLREVLAGEKSERMTLLEKMQLEEKSSDEMEEKFLSEIESVKVKLNSLVEENVKLKEKETERTNKLSNAENLKEQVDSYQLENAQLRELLEGEKNDRLTDNTRHENALKEMQLLVKKLEKRTSNEENQLEQKFLKFAEGFQFDSNLKDNAIKRLSGDILEKNNAIKQLSEEILEKNKEIQNMFDKCKQGFINFCTLLIIFFLVYAVAFIL